MTTSTAVPNRPSSVQFDLWFTTPEHATLYAERVVQKWIADLARRNSHLGVVHTSHRKGDIVIRFVAYHDSQTTHEQAARHWGNALIKAATLRWHGLECKRASIRH